MTTRLGARILRMISTPLVTAGAAAVVSAAAMAAQLPNADSRPIDLPSGPAKAGFDIARFSAAGNGWFETFYVTGTQPLRDVLIAGRVAEDTRLLVTDTGDGTLALLMDQMGYHHIAQGRAGGKDWLVSF